MAVIQTRNITDIDKITTFYYKGNSYSIVALEGGEHYAAINNEYINEDDKLNRSLNATTAFITGSIEGSIQAVKSKLDVEDLMAQGYTKGEAVSQVFDLPLENCKNFFDREW